MRLTCSNIKAPLQSVRNYLHWLFLGLISLSLAAGTLGLSLAIQNRKDYLYYQSFTEKLASGILDLSIPGFHGTDFAGAVWFLISRSPISHIQFQQFSGILIPAAAYLAASSLFNSKKHGLLLASISAMMPYAVYPYMSGYTQAANILFFLLAIFGAARDKWWTGLAWAIAITTKPFAIILLPLIYTCAPANKSFIRRHRNLLLGLALSALYVIAQYAQTGNVSVGVHPDSNAVNIWRNPFDAFFNAAWGIQSLFSVHNYFFANPAGTGHWNMLHTTPVLIFLGLFALIAPELFFKDNRRLHTGLLLSAIFGFLLNSIVSMDNFYMQFLVFVTTIAALPVLAKHPLWIPVVLITLHYQWFYFYLDFSGITEIKPLMFALPTVLDSIAILWVIINAKKIARHLRHAVIQPFSTSINSV